MRSFTFLPIAAVAIAGGLLTSCGSSDAPADAKKEAAPAPPAKKKVPDHTAALVQEHLTSSRVVEDHILDIDKLPGGSLGEYANKGKKYQMFIVEADSNTDAALLLIDMKKVLNSDDYISYMGGYYGVDAQGRKIYVFSKKEWLAGIVGLSKAEADPIARVLAGQLH
jgi:hypothetical protein